MTPDERASILRRNQGQCLGCGGAAKEADHFKPRHAGGPETWYNMLPLCSTCNKIKSCLWPGHGYHPIPGYNDLDRALGILSAEITFQVAAYGKHTLLAALSQGCLSPDAPALRAIRNSDALRAEVRVAPPKLRAAFSGQWGYWLLRDAAAGQLQWTQTAVSPSYRRLRKTGCPAITRVPASATCPHRVRPPSARRPG